ncbi:MAG: type III-B CRISPR-associated protein Cas10/Cmr2 [Desulfobacteraceae bacterium]|jgi:CRISPR-associated protein Cmr2|nr:type III-B CRISPR-associated protein Cas10/Cmr2 [Desulfobacteraceae bacterium]
MKKYLIQISIGPVQDFIASARKLRDLWFGSHILSELSKTVARSMKEQGATLIFPYISANNDLEKNSSLIVANKIFAELESDLPPSEVIANAKKAWAEHRQEYADTALENITKIKKIKINESLYKRQIADSGEFFAAWVEYSQDYKEAKTKLERLMAGRKNLREFNAPAWDGTGTPKNSLDGIREAVTGEDQDEVIGLIKKNERLDTLGCIKRFAPLASGQKKHFDDLSKVALIPWLIGLKKTDHTGFLTKFINNFNPGGKDQHPIPDITDEKYSECFFYETKKLKQAGAFEDYIALKRILGEPQKYACILIGDGDNMGNALGLIETADGHRTFTKHLGEFAKTVEKTIEKFDGSLIYAGGDDVMAYVPIHTIIDCADAIRKEFAESMKIIFNTLGLSGTPPTFSVGAAIVHHSMPLDQALNAARKAEGIAKDVNEKNALAIIRQKRSSGELIVKGKWDTEGTTGIISKFTAMCDLYKSKKLPATLAYQLRQARVEAGKDLRFTDSSDDSIVPQNAASALVLSIFTQKEHNASLKDLLLGQTSIQQLSDKMVCAHQIAKAQRISQGEKL